MWNNFKKLSRFNLKVHKNMTSDVQKFTKRYTAAQLASMDMPKTFNKSMPKPVQLCSTY